MARMLKVIRVKISLYFNFTARRKGMKLQFYRGFIFFMYYRGSSYRVPTVFFFFFFFSPFDTVTRIDSCEKLISAETRDFRYRDIET